MCRRHQSLHHLRAAPSPCPCPCPCPWPLRDPCPRQLLQEAALAAPCQSRRHHRCPQRRRCPRQACRRGRHARTVAVGRPSQVSRSAVGLAQGLQGHMPRTVQPRMQERSRRASADAGAPLSPPSRPVARAAVAHGVRMQRIARRKVYSEHRAAEPRPRARPSRVWWASLWRRLLAVAAPRRLLEVPFRGRARHPHRTRRRRRRRVLEVSA